MARRIEQPGLCCQHACAEWIYPREQAGFTVLPQLGASSQQASEGARPQPRCGEGAVQATAGQRDVQSARLLRTLRD